MVQELVRGKAVRKGVKGREIMFSHKRNTILPTHCHGKAILPMQPLEWAYRTKSSPARASYQVKAIFLDNIFFWPFHSNNTIFCCVFSVWAEETKCRKKKDQREKWSGSETTLWSSSFRDATLPNRVLSVPINACLHHFWISPVFFFSPSLLHLPGERAQTPGQLAHSANTPVTQSTMAGSSHLNEHDHDNVPQACLEACLPNNPRFYEAGS